MKYSLLKRINPPLGGQGGKEKGARSIKVRGAGGQKD